MWLQGSNENRRAKSSRCCHPRYCVAALRAGQVWYTRLGVLSQVGRATPAGTDEKHGEEAGRSPPSRSRASLSRHVWAGRSSRLGREATLPGLRSTPCSPPRLSALPAGRRRGPRSPDCPCPSTASGEVRAGGGGGDVGGGGEPRSGVRGLSPSCCRRPPSPRSSVSRAGRAWRRAGEARTRPRREEELAEGPPYQLCQTSHGPGGLRGPGCNFSLEAQIRSRAHARSSSGTRAPGAPLPRAPSVYFFLLLSFSHSKIGQRMEVTPGTAPGSDAKAAFSPRLRKSIATIQFGGASRPHTALKARRPWL